MLIIVAENTLNIWTLLHGIWSEEEEVPFDKQHLEAQIKAGGGVVLERLDVKQVGELFTFTLPELHISFTILFPI